MNGCQVLFDRGSGIGTRLFPWARCTIFSYINRLPMLSPRWVQPRIGPLLRGGINLSSYHRQILLYGLFQDPRISLSTLSALKLRSLGIVKPEPSDFTKKSDYFFNKCDGKNIIFTFKGDINRFKYLNGYDELIKQELINITKKKWLNFSNRFTDIPIGINVRLGNDFKIANHISDHYSYEFTKTSISWFASCLVFIRETLGFNAKAFIVSDGSKEDLNELLSLPNTHFIRPGCAISDLLILSKSKILIRSGGSSFSAWASFLGQMPTISHPGQSMDQFNMINKYGLYTGEFITTNPNKKFCADIKSIQFNN